MSYLTQKTIKNDLSLSGIALHSGNQVNVCIKPAEPNFGIVFKRVDLNKNNLVYPNFMNVSNTSLNTTIENEFGVKVSTIEHLMGAFYGLGVDNAVVEMDAQEVPIADGSAKNFVELILKSGFRNYEEPIKLIKVNSRIEFKEGSKSISIEKSNVTSEIDFEIKYNNSVIKTQRNKVSLFEDDLKDIYNSRTFCLYEDIKKLEALGLGKGGNLDNAIVVKNKSILNKEGLRNKLEFVNHKILDCMGDLFLSGYRIVGSIKCSQGGHKLTNQLLRKVFSVDENFSIIEVSKKAVSNTILNRRHLRSIA